MAYRGQVQVKQNFFQRNRSNFGLVFMGIFFLMLGYGTYKKVKADNYRSSNMQQSNMKKE